MRLLLICTVVIKICILYILLLPNCIFALLHQKINYLLTINNDLLKDDEECHSEISILVEKII